MGSGPMRAAAGKEALFDAIGYREQPEFAVGVLETRKMPPDDVCQELAKACGVAPERLTLLAAPTASLAGTVQVVARSVETALHKLFELGLICAACNADTARRHCRRWPPMIWRRSAARTTRFSMAAR